MGLYLNLNQSSFQKRPTASVVPIVNQFWGDLLREILKHGAKKFLRDKGDDPTTAKHWLCCSGSVIAQLKCMPKKSLLYDVSLLEGEVYQWSKTLVSVTSKELVDWDFFMKTFKEKYVNPIYAEQMKIEFLYLR